MQKKKKTPLYRKKPHINTLYGHGTTIPIALTLFGMK
jgi:hypothetical protein